MLPVDPFRVDVGATAQFLYVVGVFNSDSFHGRQYIEQQVRKFVNADYWTRDSWVGFDLCRAILVPRSREADKAEREKKEWTA